MKLAVFASLIASVAAFSPAKQAAQTTALDAKSNFETELGVQRPVSIPPLYVHNEYIF